MIAEQTKTIRLLIAGELPQMLPLAEAYLKASVLPLLYDGDRVLSGWLNLYAQDRGWIWGLFTDERLVGLFAAHLAETLWSPKQFLNEWAWWVEPDFRHGTSGLKLLLEAERHAGRLGLRLRCGAYDHLNGGTLSRLYLKRGYTQIGTMFLKDCGGAHV